MSKETNITKAPLGSLTRLYMAKVELALYSGPKSTSELSKLLAQCGSYPGCNTRDAVSSRTVQSIISKLKETYKLRYEIPEKDAIKVSRSGIIPKYILGEIARGHLLFPENIFYSKTDRDKLNLLLRVGEYFSLPMEAFLDKEHLLKEGADELFSGSIEVRKQPFNCKVFADVFSAVENHQVIEFKYEALTTPHSPTKSDKLIVSPYYLKSYGNKWYLIGHIRKSLNQWTVFALDRISELAECQNVPYHDFDTTVIKNFYKHVIGFYVQPNPDGSFPKSEDELDIKFITITMKDDKGAFFLSKNPIHKSQRQSKDNHLEFHLKCLDNIHLYQALLKIIDDIKWIEPPVVRNRLTARLEEALKRFKPQCFCDNV